MLDPAVKSLTVGLVSYLREYLLKLQPDKVRDGIEGAKVFWLSNVRSRLSVSGFDLPCPPSAGAPAPPSRVRRLLVVEEAWRDVDGYDRGDTHELVLGVGLLTTGKGGRRTVRRHLPVCDVTITVDPVTEMLEPSRRAEARRRAAERAGSVVEHAATPKMPPEVDA